MTAYIFLGMLIVMLGALVWRILKKQLDASDEKQVYRQVVERMETPDGEHVTLSCGHHIVVQRHRREQLPCAECRETKERIKGA